MGIYYIHFHIKLLDQHVKIHWNSFNKLKRLDTKEETHYQLEIKEGRELKTGHTLILY